MTKDKWPKIIQDNCLDLEWQDEKIWKLDLPITKMAIKKLSWQFEIPFWRYGNKKYAITPNQVITNPKKYHLQYKRIIECDLKYPLDIIKNQKGNWEILDGLHRLVKAKILGHNKVNVRKIPKSKIKDIQ